MNAGMTSMWLGRMKAVRGYINEKYGHIGIVPAK